MWPHGDMISAERGMGQARMRGGSGRAERFETKAGFLGVFRWGFVLWRESDGSRGVRQARRGCRVGR